MGSGHFAYLEETGFHGMGVIAHPKSNMDT